MNKSRRDFLKKLPLAMSVPFSLGGLPVKVLGQNSLTALAAASTNDKVLVILQMHGGNDGLNCLIPVEKYDDYYNSRANIAIPARNSIRKYIPLDSTLPSASQVGLHPDMQAMKVMYDQGRMAVVQGVSYQNNNGSHFRGRDIWFMGGSASDYMESGWLGRYLQGEYAPKIYPDEFPNPDMEDPLAIEIGADVSLIFHQRQNIPTSISLYSIPEFADLVDNLEGFDEMPDVDPRGIPPEYLVDSPYYNELKWILDLEDKTQDYAATLAQEYALGITKPTVTYPNLYPFNAPSGSKTNPLSYQLKMVANLLAGGCKTKVFLVKIGGFDTHADQVEKYDPTMGAHAALMYHISTAMKAFQEDLRIKGLEDLVLSVTTSEFGRRVKSNGSFGTDHGTAGPLFIFGKGVKAGVHGEALKTTASGNNLDMQYDYRVVYANIMRDWMGVDDARLNKIFPDASDIDNDTKGLMTTGTSDGTTFEDLQLASQDILSAENGVSQRFALVGCYPNPASVKTTVHFKIDSTSPVTINLFDTQGRKVNVMVSGTYVPGEYKEEVQLTGLKAGNYVCEMRTGFFKESKKLVIVN